MKRKRRMMVRLAGALLLAFAAGAQEERSLKQDLPKLFARKEAMIPMRDGGKLHTEIYTPGDGRVPPPMFLPGPSCGGSGGPHAYSRFLNGDGHLYADGYIFVSQDIRG